MEINIRNHIKSNFENCKLKEIKEAIEESLKNEDEITLPGLGVFFELLWKTSSSDEKDEIVNTLEKALKKAE